MSTLVSTGRGTGLVVNTGTSPSFQTDHYQSSIRVWLMRALKGGTTEVGKISAAVGSAHMPQTPLQIKLEKMGKW